MYKDKEFTGIWMPIEVVNLTNIGTTQKMMLSIIIALSQTEKECFASNKYFSEKMQIKECRVSEIITELHRKGLISYDIDQKRKNKRIIWHYIDVKGKTVQSIRENPNSSKEKTVQSIREKPIHDNKDYKKENKKNEREGLALSFLKENELKRYNAFIDTYQHQIKMFDKFLLDFNDTVEMENIPFEVNKLFARWKKYARNYIHNQERFDPIKQTKQPYQLKGI